MTSDSELLDRRSVRRHFGRAAPRYQRHGALQATVAARLEERLDLFKLEPGRILDLGCGPGASLKRLGQRYPGAQVLGLDLAWEMCALAAHRGWFRRRPTVCAHAAALPLLAGSLDLVFSSLMLQWCLPPDPVLQECRRVLSPHGLLLLATLGPSTLHELRSAWPSSAYLPAHPFIDLHDLGDALIRAGFVSPVVDVETITMTYADPLGLLRDLSAVGATDARRDRPKGLLGPAVLRQFQAGYARFRLPDGRFPASYEVVYAHAFVPDRTSRPQDGSTVARFPVSQLRRSRS